MTHDHKLRSQIEWSRVKLHSRPKFENWMFPLTVVSFWLYFKSHYFYYKWDMVFQNRKRKILRLILLHGIRCLWMKQWLRLNSRQIKIFQTGIFGEFEGVSNGFWSMDSWWPDQYSKTFKVILWSKYSGTLFQVHSTEVLKVILRWFVIKNSTRTI